MSWAVASLLFSSSSQHASALSSCLRTRHLSSIRSTTAFEVERRETRTTLWRGWSHNRSFRRMSSSTADTDTSIVTFVKNVKKSVLKAASKGAFPSLPHLVIGNSAGDADSIISAIGLAFVDSTVETSHQKNHQPVIPIVSIRAEDLKSQRPETTFLLRQCAGIDDLDDLIAIDQYTLLPNQATLTLVDHNHYHDTTSSHPERTWTVTEIVDHHLDDQQHLETCPHGPLRNIAFADSQALVASTCTLIVERFYGLANTDRDSIIPPSLAILLLGVILLDSINMLPQAGKGTHRDGNAIRQLLNDTDWARISLPEEILTSDNTTPDPTKLFECLQAQKFSPKFWKELTALQGIRMDYKSFPLATAAHSGDQSFLGISTILLDMETFWKKHDILTAMTMVIEDNRLQCLGLMFTFMETGSSENDSDASMPRRQLALVSRNKDVLTNLVAYLMDDKSKDVDLKLSQHEEICEEEVVIGDKMVKLHFVRLDQGNSSASRKQVAPIVMGYWRDDSPQSRVAETEL